MWQKMIALGNGGGVESSLSLNEYNLSSAYPQEFECTNAYFTAGEQNSYSQYLVGSLVDGVLTIYFNWNNYYSVSYSSGKLVFGQAGYSNSWLKIMYS